MTAPTFATALRAATIGSYDAAAAAYAFVAGRCQAAPRGSRSAAIWCNRRSAIMDAINERGLIVRKSPISGGYLVGRAADFLPVSGR